VFDGTLLLLTLIVGALAAVAYARGGEELLRRGLFDGGALLWRYAILICISFLAAGLAAAVLPEAWVARTFGAESGFGAILVATGIGIVTPAGPFVAFISGWSLLALHRFIAWEVPMLGWRFAALRYGSCVLLPPLAGWIARTVTR